jgi:hypothetical protein
MPEFMDVHKGMVGITRETLMEAHQADLDIQDDEGVNFKHTWADPESGMAWCLSEAPNAEAVKKIHHGPVIQPRRSSLSRSRSDPAGGSTQGRGGYPRP